MNENTSVAQVMNNNYDDYKHFTSHVGLSEFPQAGAKGV